VPEEQPVKFSSTSEVWKSLKNSFQKSHVEEFSKYTEEAQTPGSARLSTNNKISPRSGI